jgi:cobalt/nickel transport system permease protein
MHIPDGYLGPQTYIPAYAVMVPFWTVASRKLQAALRARQTPMLALAAAFSFVIMMFNIPIPGGTTGHAVGSVLIAILLGPWAAVVAVSIALIIQALMFGDGGVTAIGANCLNMAVIMPFTGYAVYRLIARSAPATSSMHKIGAAIGGYVGLNAAALSAGIMFGIQPLIAHDAHGHALYNPFGLAVAVPAMTIEHLLLFGFVEAIVTGLVVAYVQRTEPSLIRVKARAKDSVGAPSSESKTRWSESFAPTVVRRAAIALAVLVVLAPLGLYLPARFGAGSAWGEWSADEIAKLSGYVPSQLARVGSIWHAPLPDYAFGSGEEGSLGAQSIAYIVSALVGTGLVVLAVFLFRKLTRGRTAVGPPTELDASSTDS